MIVDHGLRLQFEPTFLSAEEADDLFQNLDCMFSSEPKSKYRRANRTFGDSGLVYIVKFRDNEIRRPTLPWREDLLGIKKRIEALTGDVYNICVVQRYPTGKIGISPHRDKEMKRGTTIAGVSLGETRTLTMSRGWKKHELVLTPGSLYIMHPPTNDTWAHSIEKDESKRVRLSLTFRNYV